MTIVEPVEPVATDSGGASESSPANWAPPLWLYLLFCIAAIAPFLAIATPAIVDLPNHTARLFMACRADDPAIASMYTFHFGIIPNLAIDLINAPLCGLIDPMILLKLVIAGALCAICASAWFIRKRLFGRSHALILLVPALGMNLVTIMGYVNFLVGMAILTALVAFTVAKQRSFPAMAAMGNIVGILLFFSHIFALALALAYYFGHFLTGKRLVLRNIINAGWRTALMFAAPLLLIPLVPRDGGQFQLSYASKLRALFAPFMATEFAPLEMFFGACLLMLLAGAVVIKSVRPGIHPAMRMPIYAMAAYILLVPNHLMDAIDIDARSAIPFFVFFFCAFIGQENRHSNLRIPQTLTVFAAVFAVYHVVVAVRFWQPFTRDVQEFRSQLGVLPVHAKVLSVADYDYVDKHGTMNGVSVYAYTHLASYATMDRLVFNPIEFTGKGMQPMSATPRFQPLDAPAGMPITPKTAKLLTRPITPKLMAVLKHEDTTYAVNWHRTFDYVIYYHFGASANFDPARLELVKKGSFFSILKVRRP